MKCMSCGAPISPAFKSAISSNLCPACGGEIMNEATLDLLDELKEALEEMPNDPEGLAGWLLSNYEMRKIGTGEPVGQFYGGTPQRQQLSAGQAGGQLPYNPHYQQFMPQDPRPNTIGQNPSMMSKEEQLRSQPKVAQNKIQQFYANAGIKPKQQQKFAALAQQIQGEGVDGPDYGAPEIDYGDDPYDQGGVPAEVQDPDFTNAVLNASSGMEKPMTREDRIALQRMMSGAGNTDDEGYDPSLPPALNMERMERLRKQQDLAMGGKIGKISRSS